MKKISAFNATLKPNKNQTQDTMEVQLSPLTPVRSLRSRQKPNKNREASLSPEPKKENKPDSNSSFRNVLEADTEADAKPDVEQVSISSTKSKNHPGMVYYLDRYTTEGDHTLHLPQAKRGGFSSAALNSEDGAFRAPSNPTLGGYSSGYHEAAVTTDTYVFLRSTFSKLGSDYDRETVILGNAGPRSFFSKYKGVKIYTSNLRVVMDIADGYRTDTAQTVISTSTGKAAGHSGSGLDTTGQADAHNILREAVMELLQANPKENKGITKRSIAISFGAMVAMSIAPEELVKNISGEMKATGARSDYEKLRSLVKIRVLTSFEKSNPDEKKFINKFSESFLEKTQRNTTNKSRKLLIKDGEQTPITPPAQKVTGSSQQSPIDYNKSGLFFTQPFRAERRSNP